LRTVLDVMNSGRLFCAREGRYKINRRSGSRSRSKEVDPQNTRPALASPLVVVKDKERLSLECVFLALNPLVLSFAFCDVCDICG